MIAVFLDITLKPGLVKIKRICSEYEKCDPNCTTTSEAIVSLLRKKCGLNIVWGTL